MYFHMLASPCARIVGRSFDKHMRSPCSQVMPKRKPERAVLEEAYDIEKLLWYPGPAGAREYLACWKGFSAVGDTWEPERHIHPTKLITPWNAIPLTVRQAVWLLREAIARQLTSRQIAERTARFEFIFTVEELRTAGVGHAVLQHLAAIAGVQVTVDGGAMGFALDVDALGAIDRVVLLHASRVAAGVGGLRICCGAASYEDMMMVTGIVLRSFQAETDDGTFGAYKFEVTLTTTIFNGKSGAPRWRAAPPTPLHRTQGRRTSGTVRRSGPRSWRMPRGCCSSRGRPSPCTTTSAATCGTPSPQTCGGCRRPSQSRARPRAALLP